MTRYRSILSNTVFFLQVMLVLLVVFNQQVSVPVWLQSAGRFHPLLLHFPISFLLLLIALIFFRKQWAGLDGSEKIYGDLLLHAVFFATVSAISGLFLSTEDGYDPDILNRHMWLGAVTALTSYAAWLVYARLKSRYNIFILLMIICGTSLIIGSHFGGTLTHGENYLSANSETEKVILKKQATDSTAIYEAAIQPLLEARCYGCHNSKKAKGELVMSDAARFVKGGKDGPPWIAGDPANSILFKRLVLDAADKKHMPPKGKPQLTESEIALIHQWIGKGASFEKSFRDFEPKDSFRVLASTFVMPAENGTFPVETYTFPAADPGLISKLNSPYRSITEKSNRSPALLLTFYISRQYKPSMLEECKPIQKQVVAINLSNMPVEDNAIKEIAQFENLEMLLLNGTNISGSNLSLLQSCIKLKRLSLANTKVKAAQIEFLGRMPSLEKVYLWQTNVMPADINMLKKKFPQITWDRGFIPDTSEQLKLTPPLLVNPDKRIFSPGESLSLRHPMPGVRMRYTTNGKDPDSTESPLFTEPVNIKGPVLIKARTVSPGWYTSDIAEFMVFESGIKPVTAALLSKPDPKYSLQGGASLTDGNKGESNNLLVNWLGFRENPFIAQFGFKGRENINRVILSMADNTGSYIFPPVTIKVYGGNDSAKLSLIGTFNPPQPSKYGPSRIQPYSVNIKPGNYNFIKVEAVPVPSLPKWHNGKKEKGWIFIDEVFFY